MAVEGGHGLAGALLGRVVGVAALLPPDTGRVDEVPEPAEGVGDHVRVRQVGYWKPLINIK